MWVFLILPLTVMGLLLTGLMLWRHPVQDGGSACWTVESLRLDDAMWRLGLAVVGLLLVIVNLNLWIPGRSIGGSLVIAASISIVLMVLLRRRIQPCMLLAIVSVAVAISLLLVWLYWMFGVRGLWLLEGPNHDSLFYYQGAQWVLEHQLRVDPAEVIAEWGLGSCQQGAVYIGTDCTAYRGGSYTLLALGSFFTDAITPNRIQVGAVLAALFPILGMLPGLAAQSGSLRQVMARVLAVVALGALAFITPPLVSAVVNANVATVFGSALVGMVMAWTFVPCPSPAMRATGLGLAAGLAGHVYGEAAVYACFLVAVGVFADAVTQRRPSWIMWGGLLAFFWFAAALNVQLPDLVRSYFAIGQIAVGGDWAGWFLQAPLWTWLGAPFTGVLMGGDPSVRYQDVVVGAVLTGSTILLAWRTNLRIQLAGLLAISVLMVVFIEMREYAYGEHKIIQMLGPAWAVMLFGGMHRYWQVTGRGGSRRLAGIVCLVILLLYLWQSAAFVVRAKQLLNAWMPAHGLAQGFADPLGRIRAGDEVIIDDSGVSGSERFQKTHYLAFLLQIKGAKALLPDDGLDPFRGGYVHSALMGGFENSQTPDWIVQIKSDVGTGSVIDRAASSPGEDSQEYKLYSIDEDSLPIAVSGYGWYPCEASHCWTKQEFTVEVFAPAHCAVAEVNFEMDFFSPPTSAEIVVSDSAGTRHVSVADARNLTATVSSGWGRISVMAGWPVTSPKILGQSVDDRLLFARIDRIEATCIGGQ